MSLDITKIFNIRNDKEAWTVLQKCWHAYCICRLIYNARTSYIFKNETNTLITSNATQNHALFPTKKLSNARYLSNAVTVTRVACQGWSLHDRASQRKEKYRVSCIENSRNRHALSTSYVEIITISIRESQSHYKRLKIRKLHRMRFCECNLITQLYS